MSICKIMIQQQREKHTQPLKTSMSSDNIHIQATKVLRSCFSSCNFMQDNGVRPKCKLNPKQVYAINLKQCLNPDLTQNPKTQSVKVIVTIVCALSARNVVVK